jgi:hypothetical protein
VDDFTRFGRLRSFRRPESAVRAMVSFHIASLRKILNDFGQMCAIRGSVGFPAL